MRWRRNLDAMQGEVFWSMAAFYTIEQTNFILSDAELSMQVTSLISVQEHQTNSIHAGKNKTFAALNQRFFGIKRHEVEFVLKHCRTCAQKKPQTRTTRALLKPIKVHSIFERIQIDLIDMSTTPDGEYKWILHIDHFKIFKQLCSEKQIRRGSC